MKKQLVLLLCVVIASMTACGKGDYPIKKNELPQNAQNFLNQHFESTEISFILQDYDSYEVKFTNGWEIEFDKQGNWTEVDCQTVAIPDAIIPTNILNYVKQNFAQNYIVKISKERNRYDVELNNDLELEFDKNGNFIRIDD